MITALDHVILIVEDLGAATRAYATLLGREPSWEGAHAAYGTRNTLFRLDNTYIELLAPAGEGLIADRLRAALKEQGDGPFGLVFGTEDADQAHARLTAAGFAPTPPSDGSGRDDRSGAERRWRNVFLPEERMGGLFSFVIEHQSPADALQKIAPDGPAAAAVHALDHVVVQTDDADAAIGTFGENGLGLRLALDKTAEQWGARMLFFRVGGATVEVVAKLPGAETSSDEKTADDQPHRFWGIAYNVADIEAAHRRLTAAGVAISEVRKGRKPGTRVATVKSHVLGAPTLLIGPDDSA